MAEKNETNQTVNDTLVVGLGASAGGLQALKPFFASLPGQTGMAYIVVLHLAPEKESNLAKILQNETALEVAQVSERTQIKPDHVYIIPPNKMLLVEDDHLELSERGKKHGGETINLLLRTLAEKKGKYAAGIILSGSGSDGTTGLKAIKEHEGFALVQDPEEAKNSAMPQSAIKIGVVDKVLPVKEMAEELMQYRQTFSKINLPEKADDIEGSDMEETLHEIFKKIRSRIGHDFGNYRRSSVMRRISRRMRVKQVHTLDQYLNYLDEHTDEVDELFKDLLISVTSFFRDPEAFKALEEQVIPKLFEDKKHDDQLRVWVPGCATGEEAYSIAMLLQEYAVDTSNYPEIQVFASDVDEEALQAARQGRYPKSIEEDISEERLRRFFKVNGDEYIVKKELKDLVLFASHDLLRNAPFSKQDLIACRNLLIYLNRDIQEEVFNLLCYSLRPAGWLFLGRSDSHIGTKEMFKTIDRKNHIYRQKPSSGAQTLLPDLPLLYKSKPVYTTGETPTQHRQNMEKMHWRILSRLFAPQSALIDEDYNVIHATDGINQYLEYAGGEPSRNILDMVKPQIRQSLRGILFKLQKEESLPIQQKVHLKVEAKAEEDKLLEILVRKHNDKDYGETFIHVVFKEVQDAKPASDSDKITAGDISGKEAEIIDSLEKELEYTKEQLQVSIEQYETSNEELENKVEELSRTNNDLLNLIEATEVGVIFVDNDYCIQRFTSSSTEVFNLIDSDMGRPLGHITHSLEYDEIVDDVKHVLNTLEKVKKVVSHSDDRWFIMRLRPYRSTENKIEGVVIAFTEFTELRDAQQKLKTQSYQQSLATLGAYALDQNNLQSILKRGIDLGCLNLDLDCAVIYTIDREANTFEVSAQAGCAKEGDPITADGKWDLGFAFQHMDKPTIVSSYEAEQRFSLSPYLKDEDIVSSVHIVVRGASDAYGLLGFYSYEERTFNDHELNFLQSIANIVGMAIQQKIAKDQLREETERSRQYQKEILNNNVVERWELGGYLHDNLGQLLASAKIILANIKKKLSNGENDLTDEITRVNEIISDGIEGIRDLTHDIIPVDIEEDGVDHALRFLMRQTQKMYDINCTLETDYVLDKIKDRKLATHLYHIIQEAVKNAALHGKAQNIAVSIKEADGELVLRVQDDGVGFSDSSKKYNNGKGIQIMKHRMELLGGSLDVRDAPETGQTGVCITCSVAIDALAEW